jgi:hypothetical protein
MKLDRVLGDTLLGQEVLNLEPLVTLELDNLASLLVFDEGTVASEFLPDRAGSVLGGTGPASRARRQGKRTFLKAFRSFLESYSRKGR